MPDINQSQVSSVYTIHYTDGLTSRMVHHRTLQKNTINYLKRENVSFIEPQMCPPNSPDINPDDYAVWDALQQQV